jgi:TatD DNase family protein
MAKPLFRSDQYIDFHTHTRREDAPTDMCEIVSSASVLDVPFTLERHPWTTTSILSELEEKVIRSHLHHQNCLGLGEIGLDKVKGPPIAEQITILRQLLGIASDEKKSVVLHCVRAFDEMIALKKEFGGIEKWAIHGFAKHPDLAKQLIQHGFYLSLNVAKLKHPLDLLSSIPLNKLFLETDDSEELIEENYLCAAKCLKMDAAELIAQIARNANEFFRHG